VVAASRGRGTSVPTIVPMPPAPPLRDLARALPISCQQANFPAAGSGGRVAEGTGLLNAPVPFPSRPAESASVCLAPLPPPRSHAESDPLLPSLSEGLSEVHAGGDASVPVVEAGGTREKAGPVHVLEIADRA
jgi:hypothetical protein